MAGQRPHKRPRELPARPVTLDGHRQRLLADAAEEAGLAPAVVLGLEQYAVPVDVLHPDVALAV